jgi:hypothetical protein
MSPSFAPPIEKKLDPNHLKFVPQKEKLFPKFQSYKLYEYSEENNVERISLPVPPCRPVLPTNARVGYQDVRVRTQWNHISRGCDGKSVLYVGTGGEVLRIQQRQARIIARFPLGGRADIFGYYPHVIEVAPEVIVTTDGKGSLYVINEGTVIGSREEEIPFILFDAKSKENELDILICQSTQPPLEASTSHPPRGKYSLRTLRVQPNQALDYTVMTTLIGSEIPSHAILTPDIVLISQSPFRLTAHSADPDAMIIDDEPDVPPIYTYTQTESDLDISIPLPNNTPKSLIKVNFSTSTLQVQFLPPTSLDQPDLSEILPLQTSEEKPLWGIIDPMTSTWTLSSSPTGKVLDIHLEKEGEQGISRWPRVFEDDDGAEEYIDPSDRRAILERLEKYTSATSENADTIKRKFLLEEDEDIDSLNNDDIIQFVREGRVMEIHGHDLLALPFNLESIGVKVSIDMCAFDFLGRHLMTFPAFQFVASSKRLRKYCRYTERFALIVESGRGGNMYVYYRPEDGVIAKQVIVRLRVDSLGIGYIEGEGIILIGESGQTGEGAEGLVIGGL